MTHIAWVPEPWLEQARAALAGMAERHPSRTILLVPDPDAGDDRIDATVSVERYAIPGVDREVCSEVVELRLLRHAREGAGERSCSRCSSPTCRSSSAGAASRRGARRSSTSSSASSTG